LPEKEPILAFDKPQFEVQLHPDVLTLHVKEGAMREFDKLAEQTPHLRDSLRWMFHEIIPLKVKLEDIEHVDSDKMGRVTIKVPARREIHIPLDHEESNKLLEKLNQLIPREKEKAIERRKASDESKEQVRREEDEILPYIRKPA
jgi:uncharacterized protein involved in tellurium resistance